MSFPHINTALAYERHNTLLEEAQAARRAKEARAYRRAHGAGRPRITVSLDARPAGIGVEPAGHLAAAIQI